MSGGYQTCEDAVVARLKLLTSNFDAKYVVGNSKYSILDQGLGNKCGAVCGEGAHTAGGGGPVFDRNWEVLCDIFSPLFDTADACQAALSSASHAVIDSLDRDPNLDGVAGVVDVNASPQGSPIAVYMQGADPDLGPQFLSIRLRIQVTQGQTVAV